MAKKSTQHYVVAIGASAGGLEAIQEFFDHMPHAEHISFVIIQHLSPDFRSLLVELVARHTHMQVVEAAHNQPVLKEHIYVIPNTKQIRIANNRLQLSEKAHDKSPNNAIDVFLHSWLPTRSTRRWRSSSPVRARTARGALPALRSMAAPCSSRPGTARFDGMPNSAIASGNADTIGSPSQLAAAVTDAITNTGEGRTLPDEPDEKTLEAIFKVIATTEGQHFHYYKTPTILRRIAKRCSNTIFPTLPLISICWRSNRKNPKPWRMTSSSASPASSATKMPSPSSRPKPSLKYSPAAKTASP